MVLVVCSLLASYFLVADQSDRNAETPEVCAENSSGCIPEHHCLDYPGVSDNHLEKQWKVPFELINNKIVLPVGINDSRELKIILDTGKPSPGLTLFKKELGDELKLTGSETHRIRGAGKGKVTYGIMSASNTLSLGGRTIENQPVLILQKNTMRGVRADGVIGWTLFGPYAIKIDYEKKIITLEEPSGFVADPMYEAIPLTFNEKKIPFLDAMLSIRGDKEIIVSLYIDLASSESLVLLVKPEMKFTLPRNLWGRYRGKGMDGYVYGKFGYIYSLKIGSYVLYNIPTAFPRGEIRSRQEEADGILCNRFLQRFHVIFDYSRERLHIKPNF